MTTNTKTFPPLDSEFFVGKNGISRAWQSYIQGIYDVTGASSGTSQFNNNNIQPKVAGRDLRLKSNNALQLNGIKLLDKTQTNSYVLYADTSTSVNTGNPDNLNFGGVTGDIKPTFKTSVDGGWIWLDEGTIGNATSGASTRANLDTEPLYTLLWENVSDTYAPVSSGRGGSAAADFAVGKKLTLPGSLGRSIIVAGTGSGLTTKVLGEIGGSETHAIIEAELPVHAHTIVASTTLSSPPFVSKWTGNSGTANTLSTQPDWLINNVAFPSTTAFDQPTALGHENMQPTIFVNMMIKL